MLHGSSSLLALAIVLALGLVICWRVLLPRAGGATRRPQSGFASRAQAWRAAGARALGRKGKRLRPGQRKPRMSDLGYPVGRASGVKCWVTVEDSIVVLGPPRSGKGLHLVIPSILDAPGAVVTSSTRPDNLAATIDAR